MLGKIEHKRSGQQRMKWLHGIINPVDMSAKLLSRVRLLVTPWTVTCTKLLSPWDFPGKSTGVGCRFRLQGVKPPVELERGLGIAL